LAKIVTTGKKSLKSAYEPTFGSGFLLLRVAKEVTDVGCFYGQEMNPTTYNLARMNMILHGVHYQRFDLRNEDTSKKPRPSTPTCASRPLSPTRPFPQSGPPANCLTKVVFCVDRKDLDYQTIREFNGFSKGSVDSTNDTQKLVEQFTDGTQLIVTTLQKLNSAISKPQYLAAMEPLREARVIFIFDECHRSQFGDTHKRISAFFRNPQLFGFTGTPIFADNAVAKDGKKQTTKDLFHEKLHSYVITDAIKDENVLKFAVEYVGRYKKKAGSATELDIEVEGIDTRELMESPARLEKITDYILENHAVKTRNREFTAMFCVSSVEVLIKYYELFAKRKEEGKHTLKVATIFSYTANEEDKDADGILDEDGGEIVGGEGGDPHTRDMLEGLIGEYNAMFARFFEAMLILAREAALHDFG
jgi:type I restriction enzyme R subunit